MAICGIDGGVVFSQRLRGIFHVSCNMRHYVCKHFVTVVYDVSVKGER